MKEVLETNNLLPLNKGLVSFNNYINKYCLLNKLDIKNFEYKKEFFEYLYNNSFQFNQIEFILIDVVKALSIKINKMSIENEKLNEINKCEQIIDYLYDKKCIEKNYLKHITLLVKEFVDINQWYIFKSLIKNTTSKIINKNNNNIIHYFIIWINELSVIIEEKKEPINLVNLNWGNAGLGKSNSQYLNNQIGVNKGGLIIITGTTGKGKTTYFKKHIESLVGNIIFYIANSECSINIESEEMIHTFLYNFWQLLESNNNYVNMIKLKNSNKQTPIESLNKNTPLGLFLDRKLVFEDLSKKLNLNEKNSDSIDVKKTKI